MLMNVLKVKLLKMYPTPLYVMFVSDLESSISGATDNGGTRHLTAPHSTSMTCQCSQALRVG